MDRGRAALTVVGPIIQWVTVTSVDVMERSGAAGGSLYQSHAASFHNPLRHRVLAAEGLRAPLAEIVHLMLHEGTDPHGHRPGLLDPWATLLPNE